jgi:hypothetical protein
MGTNYSDHYRSRLKAGIEYQDFVAHRLYTEGIPLVMFQSQKYQLEHGENRLGMEIKFDDWLARTGNLWIEVLEKAHPDNVNWAPAGIDRGDAWLYGIGNYDDFWIFPIKTLQRYRTRKHVSLRENGTKTSYGFLLPRTDADYFSERYFNFRQSADAKVQVPADELARLRRIEDCDFYSSEPGRCLLCQDFIPPWTPHKCRPGLF